MTFFMHVEKKNTFGSKEADSDILTCEQVNRQVCFSGNLERERGENISCLSQGASSVQKSKRGESQVFKPQRHHHIRGETSVHFFQALNYHNLEDWECTQTCITNICISYMWRFLVMEKCSLKIKCWCFLRCLLELSPDWVFFWYNVHHYCIKPVLKYVCSNGKCQAILSVQK